MKNILKKVLIDIISGLLNYLKENIFNVIILITFAFLYGFYSYYKTNIKDIWMLIMMSIFFALGILSLLKSFQYLILSKKVMAKILKINYSDGATGKIQDIGSYSRGYNYNYLINNEIYTMPKYISFGSKYEIGDIVKVAIINKKNKIVMPIRLVYNTIFIGIVLLYISINMLNKL